MGNLPETNIFGIIAGVIVFIAVIVGVTLGINDLAQRTIASAKPVPKPATVTIPPKVDSLPIAFTISKDKVGLSDFYTLCRMGYVFIYTERVSGGATMTQVFRYNQGNEALRCRDVP